MARTNSTASTTLPWEGLNLRLTKTGRKHWVCKYEIKEGWTYRPRKGLEEAFDKLFKLEGHGKTKEAAALAHTDKVCALMDEYGLMPVTNMADGRFAYTVPVGGTNATGSTDGTFTIDL